MHGCSVCVVASCVVVCGVVCVLPHRDVHGERGRNVAVPFDWKPPLSVRHAIVANAVTYSMVVMVVVVSQSQMGGSGPRHSHRHMACRSPP